MQRPTTEAKRAFTKTKPMAVFHTPKLHDGTAAIYDFGSRHLGACERPVRYRLLRGGDRHTATARGCCVSKASETKVGCVR